MVDRVAPVPSWWYRHRNSPPELPVPSTAPTPGKISRPTSRQEPKDGPPHRPRGSSGSFAASGGRAMSLAERGRGCNWPGDGAAPVCRPTTPKGFKTPSCRSLTPPERPARLAPAPPALPCWEPRGLRKCYAKDSRFRPFRMLHFARYTSTAPWPGTPSPPPPGEVRGEPGRSPTLVARQAAVSGPQGGRANAGSLTVASGSLLRRLAATRPIVPANDAPEPVFPQAHLEGHALVDVLALVWAPEQPHLHPGQEHLPVLGWVVGALPRQFRGAGQHMERNPMVR